MADSTLTIQFRAQTAEVKKALAEIAQMSKDLNDKMKRDQRSVYATETRHAKALNRIKKIHLANETKETKKFFKEHESFRKSETSHLGKVAQHRVNERKREVAFMRQYGVSYAGVPAGGHVGRQAGMLPSGGGVGGGLRIGRGQQRPGAPGKQGMGATAAATGMMIGGMALSALANVAGAAIGAAHGAVMAGFNRWVSMHEAAGPAIGLFGPGQGGIGAAGRAGGGRYGYNAAQAAALLAPTLRATGQPGALRDVMAATRATGMDPGEVFDTFHTLRAGGMTFGGKRVKQGGQELLEDRDPLSGRKRLSLFYGEGREQFKKIVAAGMYSGLDKGRIPEFVQGTTRLMQMVQQTAAGPVSAEGIAKLLATAGKFGGPGLQGARGAEVFGRLHQAIIQPGGGEPGLAFMRQAFGFGVPGGRGFAETERERQQGLGEGPDAMDRFKRIIDHATDVTGGHFDETSLLLSNTLGVSMKQADELIRLRDKVDDPKYRKELEKALKESKPLEVQAQEAMKQAGTVLPTLAGLFDKSIQIGQANFTKIIELEKAWMNLLEELTPLMGQIYDVLIDVVEGLKKLAVYLSKDWKDDLKSGVEWLDDSLYGTYASLLTGGAGSVLGDLFGEKKVPKATTSEEFYKAAELKDTELRERKAEDRKAAREYTKALEYAQGRNKWNIETGAKRAPYLPLPDVNQLPFNVRERERRNLQMFGSETIAPPMRGRPGFTPYAPEVSPENFTGWKPGMSVPLQGAQESWMVDPKQEMSRPGELSLEDKRIRLPERPRASGDLQQSMASLFDVMRSGGRGERAELSSTVKATNTDTVNAIAIVAEKVGELIDVVKNQPTKVVVQQSRTPLIRPSGVHNGSPGRSSAPGRGGTFGDPIILGSP